MTAAHRAFVSTRLVVGMEIHVELATRSKMFSRAPNPAHPEYYDAAPNSLVDPVVAALPGTLPVINRAAVEMAITVGLALGSTIAEFTTWERKNYFYPDLPKGYQISQYALPLCSEGSLTFTNARGEPKCVRLIRAHLEEDTGKLGHELPGGLPYDGSLVDLNRAGTPLLEIVTQPDIDDPDDAVIFARALRSICRSVGVTEGVMQRGHMRFEPNVNVIITTADGTEHATPVVEVKNLNSFKAVRAAIVYEASRQVEAWKADGREMAPGAKSTRGWSEARSATFLQREKEEAEDYRYFPDPDLVPVVVESAWRESIAARLPELPAARLARYQREHGLSAPDAAALTEEPGLARFYERSIDALSLLVRDAAARAEAGSLVAKLLLNTGARRANELGVAIEALGIAPEQVAQLLLLRREGRIGSTAADELFGLLCEAGESAESLAVARGLLQVSDETQLDAWITEAIQAEAEAAQSYAAGRDAAAGRLVGEVMKRSGGQADARAVREGLARRLRGAQ